MIWWWVFSGGWLRVGYFGWFSFWCLACLWSLCLLIGALGAEFSLFGFAYCGVGVLTVHSVYWGVVVAYRPGGFWV